jgi:nitrile hydratase
MNGPHDLGGMMGFGPIDPEPGEPVFHAGWEARMLALELASRATGKGNIDVSRHSRERIPPAEYLAMSYYEKWLTAHEMRLAELGIATPEEIAAGHSMTGTAPDARKLAASDVPDRMRMVRSYVRETASKPAFAVGDSVKTRNMHPVGHTRLPRYARARAGTIERVHGFMVFPDSNAHRRGEDPHWCYAVAFRGTELWGAEADPSLSVSLDLWEPYLEAA